MLWTGAPPAFASSPPKVTAVIASSGPTGGGQRVTVLGTNLASPTSVKFGATAATILSSTATTDTMTSPSGSGTVDVTVTTSAGTSTASSADQYSYVAGPTAYVTNYGSSTVIPITVATNTPGSAISVGSNPRGIAITPNDQTAYVSNSSSTELTSLVSGVRAKDSLFCPQTVVATGATPRNLFESASDEICEAKLLRRLAS
jgi:YVTN family beta-propeller protein